MCRNFKLQQFEEKFAICRWDSRTQNALVRLVSLKLHMGREKRQRETSIGCTSHKAIDHARTDEQKRVHLLERCFEFAEFP